MSQISGFLWSVSIDNICIQSVQFKSRKVPVSCYDRLLAAAQQVLSFVVTSRLFNRISCTVMDMTRLEIA
jgi:hypothetical protein